jgi:outer membrane cobalamin receptor
MDLAIGTVDLNFGAGQLASFDLHFKPVYGRSEWRARLNRRVRVIAGLDVHGYGDGRVNYAGPPPQAQEGVNPEPPSNTGRFEASEQVSLVQPAGYVETEFQLTDPWRVVLGSRLDYYGQIHGWSFDPRISTHYAITDHTSLKGGFGSFSQPPEFVESSPAFGNPDLDVTRSLHASAGVDQTVVDGVFLSVEGFYKHMYDRVVGLPGAVAPRFVNEGLGRVYGMEVQGRVDPKGRFFGYLAYTLSRAERKDLDGEWRLFDFDQTHIFTLAASYRLGRGWELGSTFRYVTGNPQTPVIGGIRNSTTDVYSPIYGRLNSFRLQPFNRLDVRIEKLWDFKAWKLALYLDVQNIYNATNPEGLVYNYNYTQSAPISGLPLIPVLGLRGEM